MSQSQLRNIIFAIGLLLMCSAQAEDVLEVTDKPSFETKNHDIWGTGTGANTQSFDAKLINIHDSQQIEKTWGAEYERQTASDAGPTQFLCPAGSFVKPFTDECYTCPDGFSHNPLKTVDEAGVCFRKHSQITAQPAGSSQFLCPSNSFLDVASGGCYSCPSGYSHNPLLPATTSGVCSITSTEFVTRQGSWECDSGDFPNVSLTACYSCPSGYGHNPILGVNTSGVCSKWIDGSTKSARYCGKSKTTCTDYFLGICVSSTTDYPSNCPSKINKPFTSEYYSCDGWYHDPFYSVDSDGVCYTFPYTDNKTATYERDRACPAGQNKGIDGYCYSCPSGYTDVLGVCTKIDNTTANYVEPAGFICGSGEFLSGSSCYTCPSNYEHDFLLPHFIEGVCFKSDKLTADFSGNQGFVCPAGSFLSGTKCYQCDAGYTHNPILPWDQSGVCFKLALSENPTNPSFELGYAIDSEFHYEYGWEGGVTVDDGSVDITYSPELNIQVVEAERTAEGWPTYTVTVNQQANSDLDMTTRWPGIDMYLNPWTDTRYRTEVGFIYPKQDLSTLDFSQQQDSLVLWDTDSNGRYSLGDAPLFRMRFESTGIGLEVLGLGVDFTGFDPPVEIAKPLMKKGNLEFGVVILEGGIQGPRLATPPEPVTDILGNDVPFKGEFTETINIGTDNGSTYIRQGIDAGERTGLNLFTLNAGLKDPDVLRVDVDLDGLASLATGMPLGFKLHQKLPIGVGDYWSIAADVADLDFGGVLSFSNKYEFRPNLGVTLAFSRPVRPIVDDIVQGETNTVTLQPGESLRFIHPGGPLEINPNYSVDNNEFVNDTDLNVTSLFSGEVLSAWISILGVPNTLLPKVSMVQWEVEPNPAPLKVADLNYLDNTESSIFSLSGFSDVPGTPLSVTGEIIVSAKCRDSQLILDEQGAALLTPLMIDNGSETPGSDSPALVVTPDLFNCDNIGQNTVTLTASSPLGAWASCDAIVDVVDNMAPTLSIQSPGPVEATGRDGAIFNLNPLSSDNCNTFVTSDYFANLFPPGVTTVNYLAKDPSNNETRRSIQVRVVDTTPPVLQLPPDVSVEATGPLTPVTIGSASATDIFDVTIVSNAPDSYPLGVTEVVWTATDRNRNSTNGTQHVTVVDTTPPLVIAPPDVTVVATGLLTEAVLGEASATDAVGVVSGPTESPLSPYYAGTTLVTWTATDSSGNTGFAVQEVKVLGLLACDFKQLGDDDEEDEELHASLALNSHNNDPNQSVIWQSLFDQPPGISKELITNQKQSLTWQAGSLSLAGDLVYRIKTRGPANARYQEIKISNKTGKDDSERGGKHSGKKSAKHEDKDHDHEANDQSKLSPLEIVSVDGGLDPMLPGGDVTDIKIRRMSGVQVTVHDVIYTGKLQKLDIKMDDDSMMVEKFEVTLIADSEIVPVRITSADNVQLIVPASTVLMGEGSRFKEKFREKRDYVSATSRSDSSNHAKHGKDGKDGEDSDDKEGWHNSTLEILSDADNETVEKRTGSCGIEVTNRYGSEPESNQSQASLD